MEDPRKSSDSLVGLTAEVRIMDYYSQSGFIIGRIVDPDLDEKARVEAKSVTLYKLQQNLK